MVVNAGKLQIIVVESLINNSNITFIVENKHTKSTNKVKLLGIVIDYKLTFSKRVNNLCNTASNRLRALRSRRKFLCQKQTKCISETYIMSSIKHCPFIWMFCNKTKDKSLTKYKNIFCD